MKDKKKINWSFSKLGKFHSKKVPPKRMKRQFCRYWGEKNYQIECLIKYFYVEYIESPPNSIILKGHK